MPPRDIRDYISDDNDRLDGIFRVFRDFKGGKAKTTRDLLHALMAGIDRHIQWEEKILFPILENRMGLSDRGPTSAMREEHRKMEGLLKEIHEQVLKNGTAAADPERELIGLLGRHHQKGEETFYPMLDHSLSETEKMEAYTRMKTIVLEKENRCCPGPADARMEDRTKEDR